MPQVSVDHATAPALARLRQVRGSHEAIVRWLNLLAPALLIVFVVAAWLVRPGPGLTGRGLVVSIAVTAFVVAVLGRNASSGNPFSGVHIGFVVVVSISSATLMWAQPHGPGAEGLLLAILCIARLLPGRVAVPLLVSAFVVLEVVAWLSGEGDLAVLAVLGAFYGMLYLAFRLSEANKQAERLLAELEQSQVAQARAAGLAERQRLAREMHDVLAHSLSGLMLQLEGARMLAADRPGDSRLPQAINRAHHLCRTGLAEARRAIGMLRDDELPGPEGLAGLAAQFEQDRNIPCRFTVSGAARELGSQARLALYRVAQEALTNITKHAQPDRVEVHLAYGRTGTRLTVEDVALGGTERTRERVRRGVDGAAAGQGDGADGYGLTGMRERAELLGGRLTTEVTCRGFRVELDVPT